jgi:hypothetical protein
MMVGEKGIGEGTTIQERELNQNFRDPADARLLTSAAAVLLGTADQAR